MKGNTLLKILIPQKYIYCNKKQQKYIKLKIKKYFKYKLQQKIVLRKV